jgi:hypothetical protein
MAGLRLQPAAIILSWSSNLSSAAVWPSVSPARGRQRKESALK